MVVTTATSAGAIILREIEGELKIALAQHQRTDKTMAPTRLTNDAAPPPLCGQASRKEWVLPKGHVEDGETIEQAALREIHEEAGLDNVQLIKHLGTILRESVKSNGDLVQKTIHFFLAYALENNQSPTPTDLQFTQVGWFKPEEAIELVPYESDQAFLREHLTQLFT